jgi:hypothetical protein
VGGVDGGDDEVEGNREIADRVGPQQAGGLADRASQFGKLLLGRSCPVRFYPLRGKGRAQVRPAVVR